MSPPDGGPAWRPLLDIAGYEISEDGQVRCWRSRNRYAKLPTCPRAIKISKNEKGYRQVVLRGTPHSKHVIRIANAMLHCFVRPPKITEQVRHLNGIKDDDRLENLTWGTVSENTIDQVRHGIHAGLKRHGENHPNHRVTLTQVREIRVRLAKGQGCKVIGLALGIPRTTVSNIKHGYCWKGADALLKAREAA